ncbi:MAG TPA: hypothetical protein VGC46_00525 [Allosphingosinicella sp.]
MSDKFRFEIDRAHGLVRITMSGFYEAEDVAAFVAARKKAHDELGLAPNAHMTLNDLREMKVQSQDTVRAFQAILTAPEYRSRKLAFVVDRNLAAMQLERTLVARDANIFTDIASAERYLFADEETQPLRRFG